MVQQIIPHNQGTEKLDSSSSSDSEFVDAIHLDEILKNPPKENPLLGSHLVLLNLSHEVYFLEHNKYL